MDGRINTDELGKWIDAVIMFTTIVMKVMAEKYFESVVTVDTHLNSPQNITRQSHSKVTRKKEMITS